ncbi:unnamed protein product [Medioppia subpectinata]|uniref:Uncharacterized protein n=1 Tax=Medioppia subpectinata TaxID=1979941 RepID=A0A7R9L0T9_9ACAR|nr:unnamed protein product [Medioppia subpectinata]CAG2113291.1 unnamed protein product [Medioppia subpectinata]
MMSEKKLKKLVHKNGVHKLAYDMFVEDRKAGPVLITLKPEPQIEITKSEFVWLIRKGPKTSTSIESDRVMDSYFNWHLYHIENGHKV